MEYINIKDQLPEINKIVKCKVNWWYYGKVEIREIDSFFTGQYIQGIPMFDIETYDQAFAEVIAWKSL